LKSLYFTFNAVSQIPTPKLDKKASIINKGRNTRFTDGIDPNHIRRTNIKTNEIRKSTRLVITDEAGMIIRGKYTFEISRSLPIRLLLASVRPVAKNCQGNKPAKTSNGYTTPSEGNFAICPNTNVKIIMVSNGRSTLHIIPIMVCLYLTFRSRQLRI
jgi:hypothetical protein